MGVGTILNTSPQTRYSATVGCLMPVLGPANLRMLRRLELLLSNTQPKNFKVLVEVTTTMDGKPGAWIAIEMSRCLIIGLLLTCCCQDY